MRKKDENLISNKMSNFSQCLDDPRILDKVVAGKLFVLNSGFGYLRYRNAESSQTGWEVHITKTSGQTH